MVFSSAAETSRWNLSLSIKLQRRRRQRDKQMFAVHYHTSHGEGRPKSSARCCDLGENHITHLQLEAAAAAAFFFVFFFRFRTDTGLSRQGCEKFSPRKKRGRIKRQDTQGKR